MNCQSLIHSTAHRLGIHHEDYDDCIQEDMIAAWQAERTHDPAKAQLSTYVTSRARWAMIDYLRRKNNTRRVVQLKSIDIDLLENCLGSETDFDLGLMIGELRKLTKRDRDVIHLYFWEGMKLKEIGAAIGMTESMVSRIRKAALDELRKRLI